MSGVTYSIGGNWPSNGMCQRCGERPAYKPWVGEGGIMGFVHGAYQIWCHRCVVEAQLAYAKERAAAIPQLEAELAALV